MGLTPKQPLSSQQLTWKDLDKSLKLFIQSPGDTTIVNVKNYPYSKKEIKNELEKNNYIVTDGVADFIFVSG